MDQSASLILGYSAAATTPLASNSNPTWDKVFHMFVPTLNTYGLNEGILSPFWREGNSNVAQH